MTWRDGRTRGDQRGPEAGEPGSTSSFGDLLEGVKARDPSATEEFYRRYMDRISRVVRRELNPMLRSVYDTLDVQQSVFGEFMLRVDGFEDRGEGACVQYLANIARKKLRYRTRSALDGRGRPRQTGLTHTALSVSDDGPGPDRVADDEEEMCRLRAAMESLLPTDRQIVAYLQDDGLTFQQIAERVGLRTAGAARKRYARALVRLRDKLGP